MCGNAAFSQPPSLLFLTLSCFARAAYADRLSKLRSILSGEAVSDLHLQFLFTHNRTDLQIITALKDKLEARNAGTFYCVQ